jgi:streptogramin lyase
VSANSSGYIFTAAGTLNAPNGYAGDGGQATSAQLANPSGVVVDGYSNLYIADNGNNAIRVVYQGGVALANLIATENPGMTAVAGNIYTIAGGPANAAQPANGDGGLATLANLNGPAAVTVDSSGNIYIADYSNSAVRRVDAVTGNISSVASGIDNPTSLAVDASDSIYFTGHSYCSVQQYNPSLQTGLATPYLTMVAGNGICMASGDGNGATNAGLSGAEGVVVDGMGNLYLLESDGVRFVNAVQPSLNFGSTNIGSSTGLGAIITDDNILPAPGGGAVVDFFNPSFQLTYNRPQYFSIASFLSANPNITDCNAVPPVYPYLSPGASCGVQVQFEPQVDGGPFLGSADQPSVSNIQVPVVLALSGSGIGTLTTATLTGTPTTFVAEFNESTSPPQTFVLTNTGSSTLYATGIGITFPPGATNGYFSSTNTCTIQNSQYVLAPGGSCQITVTFAATSVGTVTGTLTVTDNASTAGGVQTIPLTATVVAPLGEFVDSTGAPIASASSAPTTPGSNSSFTVNFTNAGAAILNISPSSWAIHGANQSSFSIAGNTCGITLAAFATCNLTINFVPTPLIYSTYTAVLTLQDDSGGQPLNNGNHTYIQQSLNLVGPTTPLPAQTSSFSLQNAAFPAEPIGSSITQTVTLVLNDASNVQTITTAAGSEYSVGTYAPCSGPAGTTCAVSITFTPTGIGARPGTLIVGNLESGVAVPYLLSMTGTGSGALASLTPGIITTVVGGEGGQSLGIVGANGPATQAQVGSLSDFAMDTAGNMFLADQQNEVIWKVDTTGQAFLYAGTPLPLGVTYQQRMYGDGGSALGSDLAYIGPMVLDAKGGLYVGDYDEVAYDDQPRIRYIDPSTHIINTVVGYLTPYFWQANSEFFGGLPLRVVVNGTAYRYLAPGNGVSGSMAPVWPTTLGSTVQDGTITWINEGLYTATKGCAAETDAIGDGCAAEDVQIGTPIGLAIDSGGNLYFSEGGLQTDVTVGNSTTETETQHSAIRRVDAQTGIVTLIAGNGTFGYSPDGTLATQANIQARALAFDNEGNLYFVDAGLYVRKIDKTTGVLSTITGNATTTNNGSCGSAPGEGSSALGVAFSGLYGITFDAADNLYISDTNACLVRRIDAATQTIHTVAGTPNATFPLTNTGYGDLGQPNSDGSALEAELSSPATVRLDGLGNIYIASLYSGGGAQGRCLKVGAALCGTLWTVDLHADAVHRQRSVDGDGAQRRQ